MIHAFFPFFRGYPTDITLTFIFLLLLLIVPGKSITYLPGSLNFRAVKL